MSDYQPPSIEHGYGEFSPAHEAATFTSSNTASALPELKVEEKILTRYAAYIHDDRSITHPKRVLSLFDDFCGLQVAEHVRRAALLNDLGQRIGSDKEQVRDAAYNALKTYSEAVGPTSDTWTNVSALLTDIQAIDSFIASGRLQVLGNDLELQELILANEKRPIGADIWLRLALGQMAVRDVDEIDEFMHTETNVEPFFIQSAEIFDNLRTPSRNDHAILRDVIDVKTFYAPLNEPLRKDGLSMAQQSVANIVCLEKAGETDVLRDAAELLSEYQSRRLIESSVSTIYSELLGRFHVSAHSIDDTSQHNIVVGASALEEGDISGPLRAVWRRKSLGSTAVKMLKKSGESINDVIGITLVTQDVSELADVFANLLLNVASSPKIYLADVPTGQAVYVRGDKAYVDEVHAKLSELKDISKDNRFSYEVETVVNPNPNYFRVAKLQVIQLDGLYERAIEVAVQTEDDRRRSRIGAQASHLGYKSGIKKAERLASIHDRVDTMHEGKIVTASAKRGAKLRRAVRQYPGLPKDWKTASL